MKARTIFAAVAVAIMAGVSIFAACSKEENKGSIFSTNKNLPSNIPHYADDDAINQVINKLFLSTRCPSLLNMKIHRADNR